MVSIATIPHDFQNVFLRSDSRKMDEGLRNPQIRLPRFESRLRRRRGREFAQETDQGAQNR